MQTLARLDSSAAAARQQCENFLIGVFKKACFVALFFPLVLFIILLLFHQFTYAVSVIFFLLELQ